MGTELRISENAMSKRWYIVHTYSGHEAKAKQSLLERARSFGREHEFDEVLIPEENFVEIVKGEKRTSKRKFFPGYILVRMNLTDDTWHIVVNRDHQAGRRGIRARSIAHRDAEHRQVERALAATVSDGIQ